MSNRFNVSREEEKATNAKMSYYRKISSAPLQSPHVDWDIAELVCFEAGSSLRFYGEDHLRNITKDAIIYFSRGNEDDIVAMVLRKQKGLTR